MILPLADLSSLDTYADLIKNLGVPIAFATILLWHFLRLNRGLDIHNRKLVEELQQLRSRLEEMVHQDSQSERLLLQNEALGRIVEAKDREAQNLLRLFVEAQLGSTSGVAPKARNK